MKVQLLEKLYQRFKSFEALAMSLSPENLGQKIDVPKNKSLGEHFWCVIGARESYTRAIEAGSWQGFACSVKALELSEIQAALQTSAEGCQQILDKHLNLNTAQNELLLSLYEHEVMHEGQMIRHMYALEIPPIFLEWA